MIDALQNEVRILLHLAGKIDRAQLDYRPTPKQRSTLELLRYLAMMGPTMLRYTQTDTPDPAVLAAAAKAAEAPKSFYEKSGFTVVGGGSGGGLGRHEGVTRRRAGTNTEDV